MGADSERTKALIEHAQSLEQSFQSLFQYQSLFSLHARLAFETLEKVGEGGMGTVYRILDKRLGREAALKLLILPENEDHEDVARERFLREAEITARLDHPAIPPVYEAGMTSDGQLYMLMRLIRGETLSEKIRAVHEGGEGTVRDLLEILVKVGEAVAYAHEQGVIHRDLKPSNIMVGGFGEVMVMDWGIAKDVKNKSREALILKSVLSNDEMSRAGLTGEGGVLGTLGYMSPEQLEGKAIGGESDVFSLGLILVESLTGKRAIEGRTVVEIVAETLSGNITGLKTRPSAVRELNWICRQAVELDSERRSSSGAFVEQLKSYLAGEETRGYPYSVWERGGRFVRRNAGVLTSLSLLLFLLMSFGNLWLNLENERERSKRVELEGRLGVREEKKRRENAEKRAQESVEKLSVESAKARDAKRVLTLFSELRSDIDRGAPFELIEKKLNEALRIDQRSKGSLLTAARLLREAGRIKDSTALLEEVVERYPPAYQALFQLSDIQLMQTEDASLFASTFVKIIEESRKRGEVNEYTLFAEGSFAQDKGDLDEALKKYNKILEHSSAFGPMYCNRGLIYQGRGLVEEALADYNKAIEINKNDGRARNNRATLYKARGQFKEALKDYNVALKAYPNYAAAYANRGRLLQAMNETVTAMADFDRAIQLNPRYAMAYVSRGSLKVSLDNNRGGLEDFQVALRLKPRLAEAFYHRGKLFQKEKRIQESMADYNRAIEFKANYSSAYNNRGLLWLNLKRYEKSLADYNQAIKCNPKNEKAYFNRGLLWQTQGQIQKGIDDYSQAITLNERYGMAYNNRGVLWHRLGQYQKAIQDFDRAISLDPKFSLAYANRAPALYNVGRLPEAIADFEEFMRLDPKHPGIRQVMATLSRLKKELQSRK